MIILGAAALISFLDGVETEISEYYYIRHIWEEDKDIRSLRNDLYEKLKLLESMKNLSTVDCIQSGLPPDWLDQLENCFYDIEDNQVSMKQNEKKKIVTKFLDTYIKYVDLICNGPANEDQIMEEAEDSYELGSSREKIKSHIIKELTSTRNGLGVSIVGMYGLGKTTLARAIAGDELITRRFPIILTPPPSSKFEWRRVIDHLESISQPRKDVKALILLDGVHRVEPDDWAVFRLHFQFNLHPESKVLITTQNSRFADWNGTCAYFLPPLLDEEHCFSIIWKLANRFTNLNLEDMGAIIHNKLELVESSKGLPLLASQIGLLLAAEAEGMRLAMIRKITGRNSWEVEEFKRVLLKLEVVSVVAQNRNLRRCLAYCSLFPPDHEFEEDDLLRFWMVEGFAPLANDASSTKGYFDELLSFSIFQTSAALPGQQPRYKLFRLYYDLALNLASKTFCQIHIHKPNPSLEISDLARHISLNCENVDEIDMDNFFSDLHSSCKNLRTFLFVKHSGQNVKKKLTFFRNLTLLRVLDLSYTNLTTLNKEDISNLTCLRYLDLSFTPIRKLPTLSKSPKLQVLKLNHCAYLRDSDLTPMTNLISLEVRGLDSLPSGIRKLINLLRLEVFIVGQSVKIAELSNLNGLRKSLHIKKLENVKSKQEARNAMLPKKMYLERLELEWTTSSARKDKAEQVLEGLQPSNLLRELKIINYCSNEFPNWMNDTQVCGLLKCIHLQGCKALPSVDRLRLLRTLCLENMHPIDHITVQRLTSIQTFVLINMEQVDMWIDFARKCMALLRNLRVEKCEKLRVLPSLDCLKLLKKLEVSWCPMLEELPALPQSLASLIIENSDNLEARCRTGGADPHKIRRIEVVINSELVNTTEQAF